MQSFALRWVVLTVAVAIAVQLTDMHASSLGGLAAVALLLGVINASIRPLLMRLALPLIVFSFGFFILIINAVLLELAGALAPGFETGGFWSAFFGAIIISVADGFLTRTLGGNRVIQQVQQAPRQEVDQDGLKRVEGRVMN